MLALLALASSPGAESLDVAPYFPQESLTRHLREFLAQVESWGVLSGRMQRPRHCSNFPPHQLSTLRSSYLDGKVAPLAGP